MKQEVTVRHRKAEKVNARYNQKHTRAKGNVHCGKTQNSCICTMCSAHDQDRTSLDAERRRRRGNRQIRLATSCEMISEWRGERRANVNMNDAL